MIRTVWTHAIALSDGASLLAAALGTAVLILTFVLVFAGSDRRRDALEGLRILLFRRSPPRK
jgi:hypothetical protein